MFCEALPATAAQKPVQRFVEWHTLAGTGLPALGIMECVVGKKSSRYVVTELAVAPQFDARGFRLTKPQGEPATDAEAGSYDVLIQRRGAGHRCECKGFLRWNQCKHVDALVALCENGQLAECPVNPDADAGTTPGETEDRCYAAEFGF